MFKEHNLGPLMLDVQGLSLTNEEREQLANPLVGGLILFSRNFQDIEQLKGLVKEIRDAAGHDLLIAVDHEGGRVQRFKEGFTHIPAMGKILPFCGNDLALAQKHSVELGWLMASELLALDIDISFAPVLDLDICSTVIGDRAFSSDPQAVKALGAAFIEGMREAGMACTGKHFPGHGSVVADSHIALPVDDREQHAINSIDRSVFDGLIGDKKIDALMPAHVIYPAFCDKPAGFSSFWLQQILRQELAFDGVIFSDDLGMEGASAAGGFIERAKAALGAGCDMILVCNNADAATLVLQYLVEEREINGESEQSLASSRRLRTMLGKAHLENELQSQSRWHEAVALVKKFNG